MVAPANGHIWWISCFNWFGGYEVKTGTNFNSTWIMKNPDIFQKNFTNSLKQWDSHNSTGVIYFIEIFIKISFKIYFKNEFDIFSPNFSVWEGFVVASITARKGKEERRKIYSLVIILVLFRNG